MIVDSLKNIEKYSLIPQNVAEFLKTLDANSPTGHYVLDDKSFVNIDEYETKDVEICKLEAHKKYIDIQMLLTGVERIDCSNIGGLELSEQYSEERDVMFFKNPNFSVDSIYLDSDKFVLLFPHDAHRPQICATNSPIRVKKVVAKIIY